MNTQRPALQNVKVRQAIEYAVDKRAFQLAAGGTQGGDLATTLITPGIPGRQDYDLYPAPAVGRRRQGQGPAVAGRRRPT